MEKKRMRSTWKEDPHLTESMESLQLFVPKKCKVSRQHNIFLKDYFLNQTTFTKILFLSLKRPLIKREMS